MNVINPEQREPLTPRVKFKGLPEEEIENSRNGKIRRTSAHRSTSGNEPSFMSPLLFEKLDVVQTPLSSLRSCSEYNRHQQEQIINGEVEHPASRSFWSSLFGFSSPFSAPSSSNNPNSSSSSSNSHINSYTKRRLSKLKLHEPSKDEDEASFLVEKFRFNQANLYDGEDYNYSTNNNDHFAANDVSDTSCWGGPSAHHHHSHHHVIVESDLRGTSKYYQNNHLSSASYSILGESSFAFDYLFGLKVGNVARPIMEIELKNLKEPKLLSVYEEDDLILTNRQNERERRSLYSNNEDSLSIEVDDLHHSNHGGIVEQSTETTSMRRVTSLRNFERIPSVGDLSLLNNTQNNHHRHNNSNTMNNVEHGGIATLENERQDFKTVVETHIKHYWNLLVESLKLRFPQQRGDELFYESIRLQPFSSGAYLRGMLLAGLSSMFFQIYNLITWPQLAIDNTNYALSSYHLILFSRILYFNLWIQIILNVLQLPFRLRIHFLCWESSRAVEVDAAINLIRQMLNSESWLLNKALGKLIDFFILVNLIITELYLWFTPKDDPLRSLVISLCATNLLTVVSRVVVATTFSFSMHDPHVLSEARRRGLSKWDLEVLPTFVFSKPEEVNNCDCSICLTNFEMGEMLISLPCDKKHSFHANCIRQWLQRQNSCPLCQRLV